MNTLAASGGIVSTESWWKSYLKATAFVTPALFFWAFAAIAMFPAIIKFQNDGRLIGKGWQWVYDGILFLSLQNHATAILLTAVALLLLVEWLSHRRERVRSYALSALVFVVNVAVFCYLTLIGIAAIGIAAILAV